jgi:predicted amidophosphoribosyltransferase
MSADCPECGNMGYVKQKLKTELKMECFSCKETWYAFSKICPKCKRPNGFAIEGLCAQCYGDRLGSKY